LSHIRIVDVLERVNDFITFSRLFLNSFIFPLSNFIFRLWGIQILSSYLKKLDIKPKIKSAIQAVLNTPKGQAPCVAGFSDTKKKLTAALNQSCGQDVAKFYNFDTSAHPLRAVISAGSGMCIFD
jgi:hypothetical protein